MNSLGAALVLVLRTYDLVGIPPAEIANAERAATAVLGRALITVTWVSCEVASSTDRDRRCDEAHQPSELIVRIIAAPARPTNSALADAYVDGGTALGSLATVYADRVRRLAAAGGVDPGTLMGWAIAHEVGHLLSGNSSHSATGLMRAVWSAAMLRRDGGSGWRFSNGEADRLRKNLAARLAVAAGID